MAIDLNALKAKLRTLEEGKPKTKKWKPKDEHTVRCLPIPGEDDLAFIIKWHYGVDRDKQMACPSTWGDDCPFCDLAAYLKSWKDEKGRDKTELVRKRDWECFKKVDAAVKHYVPVIERIKGSDKIEGPFLWEMTPKTYTTLFKILTNDDRNDGHPDGGGLRVLTSLEHGIDLNVSLKKKGEKGNNTTFDLTDVEPRLKPSAVIKGDLKAANELLARIPALSEIAKPVSSEEAEKVFAAWKATMDDSPADTAGGVEYSNAETVAHGGGSVDDTVAKLEALLNKKNSD